MKKWDVEFRVHQTFTYYTTVEAETPEEAVKELQRMDAAGEKYESEEDGMDESWDDTHKAYVVGERVGGDEDGNGSHRIPVHESYRQENQQV